LKRRHRGKLTPPSTKPVFHAEQYCETVAQRTDTSLMTSPFVRRCEGADFEATWTIINDGAQSYNGYVPADCLRNPYMSRQELQHEISDGVQFWGYQADDALIAVMGLQQVQDVTLIRHAYVRATSQHQGIGGELLSYLLARVEGPVLIGTWADATWAIRFYQRHGFRVVAMLEKTLLLRKYWSISERQIETSVVLANGLWHAQD
jgi:N-acetylglutamate synthase-like GNAT family acetyltransferase